MFHPSQHSIQQLTLASGSILALRFGGDLLFKKSFPGKPKGQPITFPEHTRNQKLLGWVLSMPHFWLITDNHQHFV